MPRPVPADHLLSRKKRTTAKYEGVLDPELAERYDAARAELEDAELRAKIAEGIDGQDPEAYLAILNRRDEAQAALDQLREEIADEIVVVYFRSIGRDNYDKLVESNPPDKEAREAARKQGEKLGNWHPIKFPVALVFRSAYTPANFTDDGEPINDGVGDPYFEKESQVSALWDSDEWNGNELAQLFFAALAANTQHRRVDLGKGSGSTNG